MARTFQTTDISQSESNYLSDAGTFHCVVVRCTDGADQKGNPLAGFNTQFSVLNGTAEGCRDKEFTLTFFDPDMSRGEKSQAWASKKQTAFMVACNLIDLQKIGEEVDIEVGDAVGQQVVISVEKDENEKYLQLVWANIYHVDDPRAKAFPKCEKSIGLVGASNRKKEGYFDSLKASKSQAKPVKRMAESAFDTL